MQNPPRRTVFGLSDQAKPSRGRKMSCFGFCRELRPFCGANQSVPWEPLAAPQVVQFKVRFGLKPPRLLWISVNPVVATYRNPKLIVRLERIFQSSCAYACGLFNRA